ncbi:MAG: GTPase HflX [Clostridia bacterium]|nr:GTPase HflX [Clostridia bacterium]
MQLEELNPDYERVLLLGIDTGEFDAEYSLTELTRLCETAGGKVYATVLQKLPAPDRFSFVGSGKLLETAELCERTGIDLIICDGELSPAQIRNLEDATNTRVIDRTTLILDIFAMRASTAEGRLQVELAQLRYSLPRLTGKGRALSRLGGGIGTRGPGESKLETDRRHIRRRMEKLSERLESVSERRGMLSRRRRKNGAVLVTLCGYTNAGKSTLMNALTDAGVLSEDKLFATLDPTSRALLLPDGRTVILIDTVGFISRLPHELVKAFSSTLEVILDSDLVINVCDNSSPLCEQELEQSEKVLEELGASDIPVLTVYNKCDLSPNVYAFPMRKNSVRISALTGEGLDGMLEKICSLIPDRRKEYSFIFPPDKADLGYKTRNAGFVTEEKWTGNGYLLRVKALPENVDGIVREYITDTDNIN